MSSILRSPIYFRQYLNLNRSLAVAITPAKFSLITSNSIPASAACSNTQNVRRFFEGGNATVSSVLNKLDSSVKRKFRVTELDINQLLQLVKSQRSLTPSEAVLILRCCGGLLSEVLPEERQKLVEKLLQTFKRIGIKFDIIHYNALLAVYFENGNKFTPSEFLMELEANGLQPDRITFQRLIAGCCKNGNIEGATKILEFMKEKELGINEQVFNSLILGHCQLNDFESAEGIVGVMEAAGVSPSNETYATLMCGYAKTGNMDKIRELFTQCENSKIFLQNRDLLKVVQELALSGHASHISEVLSKVLDGPDYNQEAINVSLHLIAAGQEEAAYEINKTLIKSHAREDSFENISSGGHYFVRQLAKCKRPVEKIKYYTNLLAAEYSNPQLYNVALKEVLRHGDLNFAKEMFKVAETEGVPLRPHYFWPLIKKQADAKNVEGIYEVLKMMIEDFKLLNLRETMREAVVHDLLRCGESWQSIFDRCTSFGVPSGTVANALVFNLLKNNSIEEAARIVTLHRAYYQPFFIRPALVKAYFVTRDVNSFLTILRGMYLSVQRQEDYRESLEAADPEDDPLAVPNKTSMISKIAYDVLNNLVRDKNNIGQIESFLKALLDNGLGISEACAYKIQTWLKPILTPELGAIIERLASEDLQPVPLPSSAGSSATSSDRLDEKVLRQILNQRLKEGKPVDVIRHQLFQMYCRAKDLDNASQMKQEIEEAGLSLSEGDNAMFVDLYLSIEDLEKAQEIFNKLKNENPGFGFDYSKTLRFITLLIKKDKIQEAEEMLENATVKKGEESMFLMKNSVKNLLNAAAEKNDPDLAEKFLNKLLSKQYIEVSSLILGPIIKAYLNRNDLTGALDKFEFFCNTYNFTPLKNELTKKFIETEDAASLQRLTDLSTAIHGEINSLIDLMECFLELGRTRQARRILETPGLRARQDRFNSISGKLYKRGEEETLKNLLEITKGIPDINRSVFYVDLLKLYADANDVDKAYSLLLQMQEQDEIPSDSFLVTLANLLKKNEREVPFQVPADPADTKPIYRVKEERKQLSPLQKFKNYLDSKDLDKALQFVKHPNIPNHEKSHLVAELVRNNGVAEALSVIKTITDSGGYVNFRDLKYITTELGNRGLYEEICHLRQLLPEEQRNEPTVFRAAAIACKEGNKLAELFKEIESEVSTADSERLRETFPIGVLLRLLLDQPQCLSDVEALCEKVKEKNPHVANRCLWNVYMALNIKPEEREQILSSLLQDEGIYFEPLVKYAEYKKDLSLLERVKETIWSSTTAANLEEKKGRIITAELRILTLSNETEEALKRLESGLKHVDISVLRRGVLKVVERQAKASNLPFNYKIPTQSTEDDDENVHKASAQ